jgi:enoyl-CoA hydratase/carnithine racemase
MAQVYRTLRVAPADEGVLGVVIDAPPMNLIGPELVRDLVTLIGTLESDPVTKVVVLESGARHRRSGRSQPLQLRSRMEGSTLWRAR